MVRAAWPVCRSGWTERWVAGVRYIRTGVRKRKRAIASYLTLNSVPYGTALDVPPLSHDTIAAAIRTLCAGELLSTAT